MQRLIATCLGAVVLCASTVSSAAVIVFDYVNEYSGGTPPAGAAPWLRATFDDGGTPGSVSLTFEALNLTGSEFVKDVYFNLDPALNPALLNFNQTTFAGTFEPPTVLRGTNQFSAGGATLFDILVDFVIAPPSNRFGPGDSISFDITGIATLTADSFNFLSVPGGHGPFLTVAKVQGIGTNDESGWVEGIPEPSSLAMLAVGGLLLFRRNRRA